MLLISVAPIRIEIMTIEAEILEVRQLTHLASWHRFSTNKQASFQVLAAAANKNFLFPFTKHIMKLYP